MNKGFDLPVQGTRPVAESAELYPHLRLNGRWRIIECRDGIQWILQARNRAETVATDVWRGRAYCTTREALIRCCDRYAGAIDPAAAAVLEALPERFPQHADAPAAAVVTGADMEARHAG